MMGLSEEQMREIQNKPLPPEMQNMINRSRSDFYAAMGPAFDQMIQPYEMILKMFAFLQEQIKEAQTKQPNRTEKRAIEKKAKKTNPIKSPTPKKK